MAGIAVVMIVSQLTKITGVPVEGETLPAQVQSFVANLDQLHVPTLALSAGVLAFLLIAARLAPKAPVPLVGMLLAAAAVAGFSLQGEGVGVVGEIPAGLPAPRLPAVTASDVAALVLPAVGVAIVAYSDNVLTGRAFATRNGYRIDANRELLALGTANLVAGTLRGFPVSSSASRTAVGDALGSRSQLYSLVALSAVVITLLVGRGVLAAFPTAALGAIVVYAALRLVDVGEFRRIAGFRRSEGMGCLPRSACPFSTCCAGWPARTTASWAMRLGVAGMHDIDDYPEATLVPGWWSTGTTRRCVSPMPRISGSGRWVLLTRRRRRWSGSC
jgi:sulfate permease, SulP family